MAAESDGIVRIDEVTKRNQLTDFIRVPWTVYAADERWVPPLMLERRMHLSKRNPYFKHAKGALWVAYRDGQPVGRISAQIDRLRRAAWILEDNYPMRHTEERLGAHVYKTYQFYDKTLTS